MGFGSRFDSIVGLSREFGIGGHRTVCQYAVVVRFDKPCVQLAGALDYFREHLAVGDYLSESGSAQMLWVGRGAKQLSLRGQSSLEQFTRLCRGQNPATGLRLGVRDKGARRRHCFFGQISAPKDVSLLYLVGGDTRIEGWWNAAVQETLHEIEAAVATRVRRAGAQEDRITGNMIAAVVTHDSSRALDPQLHTHLCLMNLTFDPLENRWKGVQPSAIYSRPGYLREVCYNKLAELMRNGGYVIEPARIGFTVKGVPTALRETFSKRRRAIIAEAERTGARSQAELQAVAVETRTSKSKLTAAQLRSGWRHEAGEHLQSLHQTIAQARGPQEPARPVVASDIVAAAAAHVFERLSVVKDHVLLREALAIGRGNVELAELKAGIENQIEARDLVRVGDELGSRESLEAESEFVRWSAANTNACLPLGVSRPNPTLSAEQARAVSTLLASRSRVTVLQGDAGTGKTTCLRAVIDGITTHGGLLVACAPSAAATDILRRELTPDAQTLQHFLASPALQRGSQGRVVLVDEAGLISARQLRDLCRIAALHDQRIILIGDTKQHTSVEAGDALRCLLKYANVPIARLSEIRRQKDNAFRAAVARFASGDARGAFDQLQSLGAVKEVRRASDLYRAAADDYIAAHAAGRTCLAISPVWSEIHAFTREVRSQLRAAGNLSSESHSIPTVESLQWTRAQKSRVDQYRPGDVLTFYRDTGVFRRHETATVERREENLLVVRRANGTQARIDPAKTRAFDAGIVRPLELSPGDRILLRANLPSHALKNGDLAQVAKIAPTGAIHVADGRTLPSHFRHFTHGYATTSHSAQGKTVDHGILILADAGLAAANLKQAYVSNSRCRLSQSIYTTDAKAARAAMQRPADRKLVLELIPPIQAARLAFLSRIARAGRRLAAAIVFRRPDRVTAPAFRQSPTRR